MYGFWVGFALARRKTVKSRVFSISVPPGVPLEKVYEKVSSAAKTSYSEIRFEEGRLVVRLVGTEYSIRSAWASIREAIRDLWELYGLDRSGETSIDSIVREIRATFPPEALVEALKIRGYAASLGEGRNVLRTNAPSSVVLELAKSIARVLEEIRFSVRGSSAKRVVASVSAGLGLEPSIVVEYGVRLGVFGYDEDERIVLKEEWRRAIRKLVVVLRSKGLEEGSELAGENEGY